jgi:hypothetical protein
MKRQVVPIEGLHERASATPERRRSGPSIAGAARAPAAAVEPLDGGDASLRDRQLRFARVVTTPESLPGPLDEGHAARWFTAGPRMTALDRLEIYRRAYHARLIECLADDYPVTRHALGEALFDELCRAYMARFPSDGPSLNFFGRNMGDFVRRGMPEPFPLRAFVADLVRLEWAVVEVIHAASEPPMTPEALRDVPATAWAGVRLTATPALALLRFDHPVNEYFQAFREGKSPSVPALAPSATVVYRSGPTVWRMDLTEPMVEVLSALVAGDTLASALGRAESSLAGLDVSAVAAQVTTWFREWVAHGLFVRAKW